MPLSYARWSELELSEDEDDSPAPSSTIGREGARVASRRQTPGCPDSKRPVREQLCPGPRSEEDLLKEQVLSCCTPCEQVPACLHGRHSRSNRM